MNNGIPSKAAVPKAPKISMITLSIRIPSTASSFLIAALPDQPSAEACGSVDVNNARGCKPYRSWLDLLIMSLLKSQRRLAQSQNHEQRKERRFIPLSYSCYRETPKRFGGEVGVNFC